MADFGDQSPLSLDASALTAIYNVHPEYIHAALDAIDTECGGMECYLDTWLGIGVAERKHLQHQYLC